jgi:malate dehydrogenase (quinone)
MEIKVTDLSQAKRIYTKFVLLVLEVHCPLLEKSRCSEGKGYGGFPVSGQWLKCTNPEVIAKHEAKVYGKASVAHHPCRFHISILA